VSLGAPTPNQALASNPGTNSATGGRSGSPSERSALPAGKAQELGNGRSGVTW
jgi:hypothetical protein